MPQPTDGSTDAKSPGDTASPKSAESFTKQTWDTVNQPGAYVCNETGRLIRVPAAALDAHKKPMIEFAGPQGSPKVTRLSPDPKSPIAELRTACASTDVKPQF